MLRKILFPLLLGVVGCGILIALGVWQVQRLTWKTTILDRIEATITAPPVALPDAPDPATDTYLPVTVSGEITGQTLSVLVSTEANGAGYRTITGFRTSDGRDIVADLGFLSLDDRGAPLPTGPVTLTGNLLWPDELDGWTPAPDAATGIWFARDLPAMALALGVDPVMVVARDISPASPTVPMPVGIAGIPNDHLGYAITWFMLAAGWALMSGLLIRRTLKKDA
ncbi:surfeit locus 1 family protein [Loktanella fryxellensis]|uniref:SURF1-like protein n=1 Tax=Loktanella fryxellensis TaxID=245187 RepID=A0A1H8FY63_9RHOB|nr:SURF1 family protein [Loktanella fryxellensis]SEN36589.1 surfeit locus 1 family protein [Loktanella fryxellensis]